MSRFNDAETRVEMVKLFIQALEKCPHVVEPNAGGEKLADEIVKGADKLREYIQSVPPKT